MKSVDILHKQFVQVSTMVLEIVKLAIKTTWDNDTEK